MARRSHEQNNGTISFNHLAFSGGWHRFSCIHLYL